MHTRWKASRLLSVFIALSCVHSLLATDEPTISVTGNAEVRVVPDQVVLTAAVESRAKTVAEACNDNDARIRGVLELLKSSGVNQQHIHTEYVSIEPIMRQIEPEFGKAALQAQSNAPNAQAERLDQQTYLRLEQPVGYIASRQFAITLVDLTKFETIYKGLIERGINRVRGIEFRTSQLRSHRDEARLKAVRAAREKAQAMSRELGATLAAVQSIRESQDSTYMPVTMQNVFSSRMGEPGAESADNFAVGQITIRAMVEVVFQLGDTEIKE